MNTIEKARQMFSGKKVLVFGLGLLGGAVGDVKFLHEMGASFRVTDAKPAEALQTSLDALAGIPAEYILGEHRREDVEWADIILRNPSIPYHHPLLEYARQMGKPIEMRSSLFAKLANVPIIGITGTRGKTTTTMMIYHILTTSLPDYSVFLGGNISHQSDLQQLPLIADADKSYIVMELSSWQLQGFRDIRLAPHVAVVTNLYPDHLNSYPTLSDYFADKKVIVEYQSNTDVAILNSNQPECHQWAEEIQSEVRWFSAQTLPAGIALQVPGEHVKQNAAAALLAAMAIGIPEAQAVRALNLFKGVPYRLEVIAEKQGVRYINDTTATTPVAGSVALDVYPDSILICGGSTKRLPVDQYIHALNSKVKRLILLSGNGTEEIKPFLKPGLVSAEVNTMKDAVTVAADIAQSGDTVLLSPGFTSFGLFANEFDRGDQFNQCVNDLP